MRPKILVVDDDPHILVTLQMRLESLGYEALTASDGEKGMDLSRKEEPDVIMLDVVMPEVSGWEVLASLRTDPAFRRTPVIVCTAYVAEAMGRLSELKGPDQHLGLLPKPFELEELIEVAGSVTQAALST